MKPKFIYTTDSPSSDDTAHFFMILLVLFFHPAISFSSVPFPSQQIFFISIDCSHRQNFSKLSNTSAFKHDRCIFHEFVLSDNEFAKWNTIYIIQLLIVYRSVNACAQQKLVTRKNHTRRFVKCRLAWLKTNIESERPLSAKRKFGKTVGSFIMLIKTVRIRRKTMTVLRRVSYLKRDLFFFLRKRT